MQLVREKVAQIIPNVEEWDEYIALFCKNLKQLEIVRYRTLAQERESPNIDEISMAAYEDNNLLPWYVALRACEAFNVANQRYPT